MSAIRSEPRTAMMAVVEVSWEDQFGTRHTCSARLEDTSPSGACIRVKVPVAIGSAIRVNSYRERFSGTTRYCRSDRRDFVVGLKKDKNVSRVLTDGAIPNMPLVAQRNDAIAPVREQAYDKPREEPRAEQRPEPLDELGEKDRKPAESASRRQNAAAAPPVRARPPIAVMRSRDTISTLEPRSPRSGNSKGRENMANKWSDLAPWRQKQAGKESDASAAATQAASAPGDQVAANPRRENSQSNSSTAPPEASVDANLVHHSPGDLLSMDDIYRAAGILAPRMGYSIRKVADMLASDHLRGVSDEMKRASVLMALDAAGISIDEVLRDAAVRQSAINSYESDQWEHFEEYWAAKAAENSHIQSELERITAQYQERIKRNLDEIAREKVIFATWQTMKQQEAQRIGEAAGICSKPSFEETFDEPQSARRPLAAAKPA